jgi:hypothetical protein
VIFSYALVAFFLSNSQVIARYAFVLLEIFAAALNLIPLTLLTYRGSCVPLFLLLAM